MSKVHLFIPFGALIFVFMNVNCFATCTTTPAQYSQAIPAVQSTSGQCSCDGNALLNQYGTCTTTSICSCTCKIVSPQGGCFTVGYPYQVTVPDNGCTLPVTGAAAIPATLIKAAQTTCTSNFPVSGAVARAPVIPGTQIMPGTVTANQIDANADLNVHSVTAASTVSGGSLTTSGSITSSGNASIGGTLSSSGNISSGGNISTISGALSAKTVTGTTSVNSPSFSGVSGGNTQITGSICQNSFTTTVMGPWNVPFNNDQFVTIGQALFPALCPNHTYNVTIVLYVDGSKQSWPDYPNRGFCGQADCGESSCGYVAGTLPNNDNITPVIVSGAVNSGAQQAQITISSTFYVTVSNQAYAGIQYRNYSTDDCATIDHYSITFQQQ